MNKRIWFETLEEKIAWENKVKVEMAEVRKNYDGNVTVCPPQQAPKDVTAKSKNYRLNGAPLKNGHSFIEKLKR
jgi:hypothetical protein